MDNMSQTIQSKKDMIYKMFTLARYKPIFLKNEYLEIVELLNYCDSLNHIYKIAKRRHSPLSDIACEKLIQELDKLSFIYNNFREDIEDLSNMSSKLFCRLRRPIYLPRFARNKMGQPRVGEAPVGTTTERSEGGVTQSLRELLVLT